MLLRVFQNELMEHRLIVRDGFRREAMHLDGKAASAFTKASPCCVHASLNVSVSLSPSRPSSMPYCFSPAVSVSDKAWSPEIRTSTFWTIGPLFGSVFRSRSSRVRSLLSVIRKSMPSPPSTRKSVESYLMMSFPEPPNNISRPSPPSR